MLKWVEKVTLFFFPSLKVMFLKTMPRECVAEEWKHFMGNLETEEPKQGQEKAKVHSIKDVH